MEHMGYILYTIELNDNALWVQLFTAPFEREDQNTLGPLKAAEMRTGK